MAVLPDAQGLSAGLMQQIANEQDVSLSTIRRRLNLRTPQNPKGRTREKIIEDVAHIRSCRRLIEQCEQLTDAEHAEALEIIAQRTGFEVVPVETNAASD